MANTFRPATSGAGQEIVARLNALLSMISSGTATAVNSDDYTDKDWLTETDGRNIASQLASLMTAFKTYVAPSAKKVQAALTIGSKTYDGSSAVTISEATTSAAGLLSASDKTKLNGIESGAQKNTVTGIKGDSESSYRTGNVNITKSNVGLGNVDNVKQYSASNPNFSSTAPVMDGTAAVGSATTYARSDHKHPTDTSRASTAVATTSANGLMSSSDKTKLNGIEAGAQKNTVTKVNDKTGDVTITIADLIGSEAIGGDFAPIYYDGSKFVAKAISFADADWKTIAAISSTGKASEYFSVGDEKTITLSTGKAVTLQILGFNHDDLADGSGKAGITFGMKNLLATKYPMNSSDTNVGGWESSVMRTSTMATLLSQLPSDLQSVIKQVSKKATAGNKSTTITTSTDKLFLFSEVELDGTTSTGYASEGTQYEYWKNHNTQSDRIKYLSNGSGSADGWWLRSPYTSGAYAFRYVSTYGGVYANSASASVGVCFGFCI